MLWKKSQKQMHQQLNAEGSTSTVSEMMPVAEAVPPGFVYETWQALFSPANVPRSVLEQLNREVLRILAEADTREFFARYGSAPRPRTLQASGEFVKSEARTAIDLVKAIGATAQ